jgi:hypothetical protein
VSGLPVQYGNNEHITAAISTTSNGIAPTGTVQFMADGNPIGSPLLANEGHAYNPTLSPPYAATGAESNTIFLSLGSHTLSAQYSGDAFYAAATSPASTVTVTPAQPVFNSFGWETANQTVNLGQTVTVSAQLRGSDAGAVPTGPFTFLDNGSPLPGTVTYTPEPATATTGSMLIGTIPETFTTPGYHSLVINYPGDTNYLPASDSSATNILVLGPVSLAQSSTIEISSPGQSASTTLTLTSNAGFSGQVSLSCTPDPTAKESSCNFTSGSTTAPTIQVDLTGAGTTVTFNVMTTGPHAITQGGTMSLLNSGGLVSAGIAIVFMPFASRRRRKFSTLALLAMVITLAACGGGSSTGGGGGGGGGTQTDPGTVAGQYSFTITAVTGSGNSAVTVTTPVAVVVQ